MVDPKEKDDVAMRRITQWYARQTAPTEDQVERVRQAILDAPVAGKPLAHSNSQRWAYGWGIAAFAVAATIAFLLLTQAPGPSPSPGVAMPQPDVRPPKAASESQPSPAPQSPGIRGGAAKVAVVASRGIDVGRVEGVKQQLATASLQCRNVGALELSVDRFGKLRTVKAPGAPEGTEACLTRELANLRLELSTEGRAGTQDEGGWLQVRVERAPRE